MSSDAASLTPQSRASAVQPLYKWDQLSETAKHRAILRIVENASAQTRPYYDQGHHSTEISQGNIIQENWVARWYLWHSFRNRDNRSTGSQQPPPPAPPPNPPNPSNLHRGKYILGSVPSRPYADTWEGSADVIQEPQVDIKAVKDSTELTMIPFMESIDGKDIKPLRNGPVSVRRMLKKQIQDSMAPSRVHVWYHPGFGSERSCARI